MNIYSVNGTRIAYLHLCHRKLWLHSNGFHFENATSNSNVEEGKMLSETSFTHRPAKWKELDLEYVKIDHYDPRLNQIREVKKSNKLEHIHIAQVKYYIYVLERRGIQGVTGLIEYPKQRKTTRVTLTTADRSEIELWIKEISHIVSLDSCPEVIQKPYCKKCACYDFCYV